MQPPLPGFANTACGRSRDIPRELETDYTVNLLGNITGSSAAHCLMENYGGLAPLARASVDELAAVDGVGPYKARALRSALLLAERLSKECEPSRPLLDNPERVAAFLRERNRLYTVETLQVMMLNTRKRLLGYEVITQGTLDTLLAHAREVFAPALVRRASAIVLAHNHPSGDPTPSESDIRVTRDFIRAGQLLKIDLLDHIIMGHRIEDRRDYFSLREAGFFD